MQDAEFNRDMVDNVNRRQFIAATSTTTAMLQARSASAASTQPAEILPGVWKFSFGTREKVTPVATRHYQPAKQGFDQLSSVKSCPVTVTGRGSRRGYLVSIPLAPNEATYGLGLQLQSFMQRGLKKRLRVNADPKMDTGDSHAPVPFYVSTSGYGVLIDTARYATVYMGGKKTVKASPAETQAPSNIPFSIDASALPAAYRRVNF